MALQDTLQQMTWVMMQDWLQKRQNQASLQNMLENIKGWGEYQERGAVLNKEFQEKQASDALQKMFQEAVVGGAEKDDPMYRKVLEAVGTLNPAMAGQLRPLMTNRDIGIKLIGDIFPALVRGDWKGLGGKAGELMGAMGGNEPFMRGAEIGGRMDVERFLEPVKRMQAQASLMEAAKPPGGRLQPGETDPKAVSSFIEKRVANLQSLASRFKTSSTGSPVLDMVMDAFVGEMQGLTKNSISTPDQAAEAKKWVEDLGPDVFYSMIGRLNEINAKISVSGEALNDQDKAFIMMTNDVYSAGNMFKQMRERLLEAMRTSTVPRAMDMYARYMAKDAGASREIADMVWWLIMSGNDPAGPEMAKMFKPAAQQPGQPVAGKGGGAGAP